MADAVTTPATSKTQAPPAAAAGASTEGAAAPKHRDKRSGDSRSTARHPRTSVGRSTDRRRRKKRRPKKPDNFEVDWEPQDQADYNEATKHMKNWKATQRQCALVVSNVGRFKSFRQKMKPDDQYKEELKEYWESIKNRPQIKDDQSFDIEEELAKNE